VLVPDKIFQASPIFVGIRVVGHTLDKTCFTLKKEKNIVSGKHSNLFRRSAGDEAKCFITLIRIYKERERERERFLEGKNIRPD